MSIVYCVQFLSVTVALCMIPNNEREHCFHNISLIECATVTRVPNAINSLHNSCILYVYTAHSGKSC